jgi:hypothetical protein
MLPAIPSAINAGARGSAGGQASILESDDFGDRSAPRGACSSDIFHLCLFTCVLPIALISMHPPSQLASAIALSFKVCCLLSCL